MKRMISSLVVGLLLVGIAGAQTPAFTPPTPEQLTAAAEIPAGNLGTLLQGADADQSATVVKNVIEVVLGLGLSPADQTARIAAIIGSAVNALPPTLRSAFATALGQTLPASAAIAAAVTPVIPTVQDALAETDAALGQAFGAALPSGNLPDAPPDAPPDDTPDAPDPILHPPPPDQEDEPAPKPLAQDPNDPPPTSDPYTGQALP